MDDIKKYWYLKVSKTTVQAEMEVDLDSSYDIARKRVGNYFKSREEAQDMIIKIKQISKTLGTNFISICYQGAEDMIKEKILSHKNVPVSTVHVLSEIR